MMKPNKKPQFEYILFDLDETLYPREAGLMDAINERIVQFMIHKVGIPADDATIKKRDFYQKHGTTLGGLIAEYNIEPSEYLQFIYDINIGDFFGSSPPLDNMLYEVPLRKAIFSNANKAHCHRVLDTLQVRSHFDAIIDIEAINYKSKPDPLAYQRALEILKVEGPSCIIVDDKPRNLIPAKDLGMTTILVNGPCENSAIDYNAPTIFHVENVLKKLLPAR